MHWASNTSRPRAKTVGKTYYPNVLCRKYLLYPQYNPMYVCMSTSILHRINSFQSPHSVQLNLHISEPYPTLCIKSVSISWYCGPTLFTGSRAPTSRLSSRTFLHFMPQPSHNMVRSLRIHILLRATFLIWSFSYRRRSNNHENSRMNKNKMEKRCFVGIQRRNIS
jgi:hypothetical protein